MDARGRLLSTREEIEPREVIIRKRIFILAAIVAIVSVSPIRSLRSGGGNEDVTEKCVFTLLVTDRLQNKQ